MSDADQDRAPRPAYLSRDLLDAYARGRTVGYLAGYRDGASGATVEAAAQAAVFTELVRRTFAGGVPFVELQARRGGYDSTNARRAREVHDELHDVVAASIAAEQDGPSPSLHQHDHQAAAGHQQPPAPRAWPSSRHHPRSAA